MDTFQAIKELSERYKKIQENSLELENSRTEQYRPQLTALASQYRRVRPKKPPVLTIPVIFGRTHNENFLSHYLAYILNPQQNGIGTAPLEAVLKLCKVDLVDVSLEKARPIREYFLENGRIDLLIECNDNLVLGIENKIFSLEGSSQTINYARVINELYPDISHPLIFLTRQGYKASSDQFIPVSYPQLFFALKQVSVNHVSDHRKLSLWEDFLEHLEVYIMESNADHFEFSEKSQLFLEHQTMIQDLTNTFKRDWDEAISFMDTSVDDRLSGGPWEHIFSSKNAWQQIWKINWNNPDYFIHFEWFLGVSDFTNGKLRLFLEIEGKRQGEILALFEQPCAKLSNVYQEHGMKYRPKNRSHAIAAKEYAINQDFNQILDQIIESFEEFRFLEPVVDEVLANLTKKE